MPSQIKKFYAYDIDYVHIYCIHVVKRNFIIIYNLLYNICSNIKYVYMVKSPNF